MKTPEIELLGRPEVEVPEDEICALQEKCISLLKKYGKGIRTKSVSFNVSSKIGEIQLKISANNRKASKASIIRIKPERHMNELVLVKKDEGSHALVFEDWGMGEKPDEVQHLVEYESYVGYKSYVERHYTNPRVASKDEFQSYKIAIDEILSSNPVN